jgi:cell shape-determining protein MreC
MEDVLGFCALVLTMLMTLSVVVWFCCSIVGSIAKTRRRLENPRYNALLRENKRLKSFLTEVEEENSHLRSRLRRIHYSKRIDRESNIGQRAA